MTTVNSWFDLGRHQRLWSIAYHSRMTRDLSEAELYELAARADARNLQWNVWGILLVRSGHFFQILEGQRDSVNKLYQTVLKDPRHDAVTKIVDTRIRHPQFGGWGMRLITTEDIAQEERGIAVRDLDVVEGRIPCNDGETDLARLRNCFTAVSRGVYRRPYTHTMRA